MKIGLPAQGLFAKLLVLLLIVAPVSVLSGADTGRPNPEKGPTPVEVEIFLLDLDSIDSSSQSFQANVYLQATWKGPRLADEARGKTITRSLDQVWDPRLQIVNQQRILSTLRDIVEIESDGTATQRARFWGSFSQPLALREIPFDSQAIAIHVVSADYGPDQVALSPSPVSGINDHFSVADWAIVDWRTTTDLKTPGPEGAQSAGIAMVLKAERLTGYYWINVFAPLILIVAMSWAVFGIDPKDTGTKISITITAMLTLIAYRFTISANLRHISYITRMDLFIFFSTILIYASLVAVVITVVFERKGNTTLTKQIDRASRWAFPLFFIASWIVLTTMSA